MDLGSLKLVLRGHEGRRGSRFARPGVVQASVFVGSDTFPQVCLGFFQWTFVRGPFSGLFMSCTCCHPIQMGFCQGEPLPTQVVTISLDSR